MRGITVEDQLLEARLERNRQAAYEACAARLTELGLPAVLMDVEHLFDGRSLVFYFLGEMSPELEALTDELAELYETQVQFRKFAEAVTAGCGPDCGTESASGCSTCATGCAIAGALLDPERIVRIWCSIDHEESCQPQRHDHVTNL